MKNILVTQRVDISDSYNERRDALDQNWLKFLLSIDLMPIIVPNNKEYVENIIKTTKLEGILFTGGNTLVKYGGDAPERDETECLLLNWGIKMNLPILGICRGMQLIQDHYSNGLINISNHVAKRHDLVISKECRMRNALLKFSDVNSYHKFGTQEISGDLQVMAKSSDGVIMAIEHYEKPIFGVMWHCERENPFKEEDMYLFESIFKG